MKSIFRTFALLFLTATSMSAEPVITLTTSKAYGSNMALSPVPVEAGTIMVDWGDGTKESYEVSPSDPLYMLRKEHKVMGETIKIYGKLKELSCSNQQLTAVKLEDASELKKLDLSNNSLTYETTNLGDAYGLTKLDLSQNQIEMLNLRKFSQLQYFDIYDNPDLTTVAFADENPNMVGITMYNTDVVHFYDEYNFPNLTKIDLHNTSLWEVTFSPAHYPKLGTLNLEGNALTDLDVSGLTELTDLSVGLNQLTQLNVSANTKLSSLSIKGNKGIKTLNLKNNPAMRSLNVSSTAITELDVRHMSQLGSLYVDSLNLTKLDVSDLMYLTTLSADATQLSYLDFTGNYFNLRYLYLKGNKNFTAQSLNFMYNSIQNPNRSGRIQVSGTTGAEQADATKYLNLDDYDSNWTIDIEGDGSASMDSVQLTLKPAVGGTYKIYRRDFSGNAFEKNYEEATSGKVIPGFVNLVRFEAEEGMTFKGIKVNGTLVSDSLFFVTSDAEVEAVFGDANAGPSDQYVVFSVYPGQESQYGFASKEDEAEIYIDWGDGNLKQGTIDNKHFTYFDGQTEGTEVKVYGDVAYINVESYSYGFGIDNRIKAIDLSHTNSIRTLWAYGNELKSIDVTNQPELSSLDVALNDDIEELDLTHNPQLGELVAYTTSIETLDLTHNPELKVLDVKNNWLDSLNLSNNSQLIDINVNNNYIKSLDLSKMQNLDILQASGNEIDSLDLTNNTRLREVAVSKNKLKTLDLSKNWMLEKLSASRNELEGLDLSANERIWYVDVRANKWDACTVNDFMQALPLYVSPGEEVEQSTTATKLWFDGEDGTTGCANDVAHSETTLLSGKNWISNIMNEGDGTGCDHSYVFILPSDNGDVHLMQGDSLEVLNGTTVKKGTELTVIATPAEGYQTETIKANGQAIEGNKFTVTKVTDVVARFSLIDTSIDNAKAIATAQAGHREIIISSDNVVEVSIVSLSGKTTHATTVSGTKAISLPAGIYVVTLKQGDATVTRKLMVK